MGEFDISELIFFIEKRAIKKLINGKIRSAPDFP